MPRKSGQFDVEDHFNLTGGLNTAQSPFLVKPTEATDGYNYDYIPKGAVTKRGGHAAYMTTADSATPTALGFGLHDNFSVRTMFRAAGRVLKSVTAGSFGTTALALTGSYIFTVTSASATIAATYTDVPGNTFTVTGKTISSGTTLWTNLTTSVATVPASGTLTKVSGTGDSTITYSARQVAYISDDSTPGNNVYAANTTTPAVFSMFNTTSASVLWCAGGGVTVPVGLYSAPNASAPAKYTTNGAAVPTVSAFTATDSGAGSGPPSGTYYNYTITLVKGSTGAESNALVGDLPAGAVASTGHAISLSWTFSGVDTTKYTTVNIYRSSAGTSAVDGNVEAGFTAGELLTNQAIGTTTYSDVDTFKDSSANVPRAKNTVLDNSVLPSGTYNTLCLWQNRLVTTVNSSVYISDVAKGESWPIVNYIQIPSEGKITGVASVSINTGVASGIVEALCIFKEREVWALTGTAWTNWVLTRISTEGCPNQGLIVKAGGNLCWVNYRGVFMWNGVGKPRYVSQLIEDKYLPVGDIDKTHLLQGFGVFYQQRRQVQWYLSSNMWGTQQYTLKLDLRLTEEQQQENILDEIVYGVFSPDTQSYPFYAGICFTVTNAAVSELLYLGDNTGQIYQGYAAQGDGIAPGNAISFSYTSPWLHLGTPEVRKNIHKVVAWVLDVGQPNMYMDYWTDYRTQDTQSSTSVAVVASGNEGSDIWDTMLWDTGIWDPGSGQIKGIAFYPNSQNFNNSSGMAFRFRFRESSNLYSPTLYGFSVYYTQNGVGF